MKILFGTSSYLPFQPRMMLGDISVLGLPYVVYDLLLLLLAIAVWALFYFIIKFTKIGKLLIAVIHDSEIASSMGINVSKFFVYTFFIMKAIYLDNLDKYCLSTFLSLSCLNGRMLRPFMTSLLFAFEL